jgi:hypothetical protein
MSIDSRLLFIMSAAESCDYDGDVESTGESTVVDSVEREPVFLGQLNFACHSSFV